MARSVTPFCGTHALLVQNALLMLQIFGMLGLASIKGPTGRRGRTRLITTDQKKTECLNLLHGSIGSTGHWFYSKHVDTSESDSHQLPICSLPLEDKNKPT